MLPKGTIIPNHVVIMPDGDRRWARVRGLSPEDGHKAGIENLIKIAKTCREWGIHTVSAWGLSTENWQERPKAEINSLMKGIAHGIDIYSNDMMKEGVRFVHLGRKDRLPDFLLNKLASLEEKTKNNTKHVFNVGLDYNGWDEFVRATQKIVSEGISPEKIDRKMIDAHMDTAGQPYPNIDLYIRTSGEQRTSGFMMWQADYAEFYWEPEYFPSFTPDKLKLAILDYSRRRRRFGGNDAVEHLVFNPEMSAKLEMAWNRLSHVPKDTRFRDFVISYLKEQYGFSKELAMEATKHFVKAIETRDKKEWEKSKKALVSFYKLVKSHLKMAFEPGLVASLKVDLWQGGDNIEEVARDLTAEEYRLSNLQASKAGHLLALFEKEKLQKNWDLAQNYLHLYYKALKERVA